MGAFGFGVWLLLGRAPGLAQRSVRGAGGRGGPPTRRGLRWAPPPWFCAAVFALAPLFCFLGGFSLFGVSRCLALVPALALFPALALVPFVVGCPACLRPLLCLRGGSSYIFCLCLACCCSLGFVVDFFPGALEGALVCPAQNSLRGADRRNSSSFCGPCGCLCFVPALPGLFG